MIEMNRTGLQIHITHGDYHSSVISASDNRYWDLSGEAGLQEV